jgi:pseudouridine synthase
VSSTLDKQFPTVIDLVPQEYRHRDLFPAGRLDKDTTGLMIITDDGAFAHNILSPSKHVSKAYKVTIDIPLTEEMIVQFKEGIKLNLKKGSEPVLCLQKLNNPIHVNNQELYISEAGTKSNYQFLYNIDSLDERSVKALEKHINTSKKIDNEYTNENFTNFVENQKALKKAPPLPQGLKRIKDKVISTCQTLNMNIAPLVDAQAKHVCYEVTGNRLTHEPSVEAKQNCYNACLQIIENTKAKKTEPWKVGETITKALDAGTWYARSYTSKDFSIGYNKQKEEQAQKESLLKSKLYSGIER